MKMIIAFTALSFCVTGTSLAQTGNKTIEQAIHDPKRVENEGKADVLQLNKNKISDSSTTVQNPASSKKKKRPARCKKKS